MRNFPEFNLFEGSPYCGHNLRFTGWVGGPGTTCYSTDFSGLLKVANSRTCRKSQISALGGCFERNMRGPNFDCTIITQIQGSEEPNSLAIAKSYTILGQKHHFGHNLVLTVSCGSSRGSLEAEFCCATFFNAIFGCYWFSGGSGPWYFFGPAGGLTMAKKAKT